jgi:hypothetical protein
MAQIITNTDELLTDVANLNLKNPLNIAFEFFSFSFFNQSFNN